MDVEPAPDVEEKIREILSIMSEYGHVNEYRLFCMRSRNATANAYARIWNLPDIWQKALSVGTYYIIEVLAQHYDRLDEEEREKVLIHELLHIPKTFSGALRPHDGKVKINNRTVGQLHKIYRERKKEKEGGTRDRLKRAEEAF